jgi:pyruvate formate lyase activating enzyme
MDLVTGTIFDIKKYAIHDGPGIRTTVFFQGCPLDCWWCHNPESRSHNPVLFYRANRCDLCGSCLDVCPSDAIQLIPATNGGGTMSNGQMIEIDREKCDLCDACAQVCYAGALEISGKRMTVNEVMAEIERDLPFYDQSDGGVTFSGGEPLLQHNFLAALLRECRRREIHTVVDTSGYVNWRTIASVHKDVDIFLYDLKLMDDERHKHYTGVSNQLILDNLRRLAENGAQIVVRIPLIPGINDDQENLQNSADLIVKLPNISYVELMGYHDIARAKYEALGISYPLPRTKPPTQAALMQAAHIFEKKDLAVKIM